jgi:hypothetical protein
MNLKEKWKAGGLTVRVAMVCIALVVALAALLCYNLYVGNTFSTRVDLQNSDDYSESELQDAMNTVMQDFRKDYPRCKLVDLWFTDKYNSDRRRDLARQYDAEEAILVSSNIWVGELGAKTVDGDRLDANTFYGDYHWILIRPSEYSDWRIVANEVTGE